MDSEDDAEFVSFDGVVPYKTVGLAIFWYVLQPTIITEISAELHKSRWFGDATGGPLERQTLRNLQVCARQLCCKIQVRTTLTGVVLSFGIGGRFACPLTLFKASRATVRKASMMMPMYKRGKQRKKVLQVFLSISWSRENVRYASGMHCGGATE